MTDPFGSFPPPSAAPPPVPGVPHQPAPVVQGGPSTTGVWLGGIFIALGVIGAVIWGVTRFMALNDTIDEFDRIEAGESAELIFEPGRLVIYVESDRGQPFRAAPSDIDITDENGVDVVLSFSETEISYDFNNPSASSLVFDITQAGTYSVEVDQSLAFDRIAIGPSIADDIGIAVAGAMAIGFVGVALGGVLMIVTLVRRRKARQLQAPVSMPPGWPPAPPGSPPGWGPPPPGAPPGPN